MIDSLSGMPGESGPIASMGGYNHTPECMLDRCAVGDPDTCPVVHTRCEHAQDVCVAPCRIELVIGPNETTEPWCAAHRRWSGRYDMCEQVYDDLPADKAGSS